MVGPFNYFAHYFLGFSVYVSNTPDISEGKLCFKDSNFTLNTIPAVSTTTCLVHGQYVIYYNERLSGVIYPNGYSEYARIDLCEVEVFGMCALIMALAIQYFMSMFKSQLFLKNITICLYMCTCLYVVLKRLFNAKQWNLSVLKLYIPIIDLWWFWMS